MTRKRLYLTLAILGTIIFWLFFGSFFAAQGPDIPLFVRSLLVSAVMSGFTVGLLLSIGIFWFWSFGDSRERGVQHWGLVLPLYPYLREGVGKGVQ